MRFTDLFVDSNAYEPRMRFPSPAPRQERLARSLRYGGSKVFNLEVFAIVRENGMHHIKRRGSIGVIFAALFFLAPTRTPAQETVVGVNVVNPLRASICLPRRCGRGDRAGCGPRRENPMAHQRSILGRPLPEVSRIHSSRLGLWPPTKKIGLRKRSSSRFRCASVGGHSPSGLDRFVHAKKYLQPETVAGYRMHCGDTLRFIEVVAVRQ